MGIHSSHGTLALAKEYRLRARCRVWTCSRISAGDLLRYALAQYRLGVKAKEFMDAGQLFQILNA